MVAIPVSVSPGLSQLSAQWHSDVPRGGEGVGEEPGHLWCGAVCPAASCVF